MLRFRSQGAKLEAERLIKTSKLWNKIGRKEYWKTKSSFQVKVQGMSKRHLHALKSHPEVIGV